MAAKHWRAATIAVSYILLVVVVPLLLSLTIVLTAVGGHWLSVQCNALHGNGTEYKITCGVCLSVCLCVHTGLWGQISRKRLEIETWYQWSTNRKRLMGNQLVT